MPYKSKATYRTTHAMAIVILVLAGIAPVSMHAMTSNNNNPPAATGWAPLVVASLSSAHTTLLSSHPLSSHQQTPSQQNVSFGSSSAQQPISPTTQTPCHAEKYAFDLEITQREQKAQKLTLAHDTFPSPPSDHTTPQNTISATRATPHQCLAPGCGKSFRSKDLLKQHGDVHKEKTIHCPVCPHTSFTSKQRLNHHRKTQKHQAYLQAAEERDANNSQNTQDQQQRDRLNENNPAGAKKRKVTHHDNNGGGGGAGGNDNDMDDNE